MKTTNKEILAITSLIDERVRELMEITNTTFANQWQEIANNLVEDFNKLVDLEKENNRLETQIESFANEFGFDVNEIS